MDGRDRGPARPMTYRELLATRVLSVDAYWQELREPSRRSPREIPVPLWPGESLQQYEREFCRWLAAQRLSLVSMREDPVTERNYRLQFAETRVARPGNAQQRQPSGPRYRRSLSRSPPPKRRFTGAQPHPIPRDDRRYVYERNPADSGRLVAPRQVTIPRERPQLARGYSEGSRAYDDWQAQRNVERPRQDTRPSPRDRQYGGDAQRWTRSRSKSPERVISVDAFRDEMFKLRNGLIREDSLKRPHETMPENGDSEGRLLTLESTPPGRRLRQLLELKERTIKTPQGVGVHLKDQQTKMSVKLQSEMASRVTSAHGQKRNNGLVHTRHQMPRLVALLLNRK
ncbi:hypothetical protein PPTG_04670 [Phytophthora nicotianae INRA-310]|uniref:Uncharacterized protein n=1 Tax=Phytophthora nicotianae (strain INRA-310) TaxID=761204 RepID=W2R4A6_PHYN3|nr:hypothetical protein PPTG_04670 [Phytophthora nicotianae INRA-310]ETN19320.1 hypothetical protein PPTG_04670 [Phytophthora nicotianae INRA-310]